MRTLIESLYVGGLWISEKKRRKRKNTGKRTLVILANVVSWPSTEAYLTHERLAHALALERGLPRRDGSEHLGDDWEEVAAKPYGGADPVWNQQRETRSREGGLTYYST